MSGLIVRNLQKKFGKKPVVRNISMQINQGNIIGLLGPNGAGKTTCFYMIAGMIKPDNGKILINGCDITSSPMHLRAKSGISYLPQENSIFRKLSVADNILSIIEINRSIDDKTKKKQLEILLEEFNIQHIRNNQGINLSGGERRRVEIARSLALDPNFILLDEPFSGVDPISINEIKQIIIHLKNKGVGILITDHNVRETLDICDHAYIINEGVVIAQGDIHMIMKNQIVKDVYLGENFSI